MSFNIVFVLRFPNPIMYLLCCAKRIVFWYTMESAPLLIDVHGYTVNFINNNSIPNSSKSKGLIIYLRCCAKRIVSWYTINTIESAALPIDVDDYTVNFYTLSLLLILYQIHQIQWISRNISGGCIDPEITEQ